MPAKKITLSFRIESENEDICKAKTIRNPIEGSYAINFDDLDKELNEYKNKIICEYQRLAREEN